MRANHVAIIVAVIIGGCALLAACLGKKGNGNITTERLELSGFQGVEMSGSGLLRLHRGAFKVEVSTDSNLQPSVLAEVSGGRLRLGMKPEAVGVWPSKLEFDVTLPELEAIELSGSGDVSADAFSGEDLSCRVSGSGDLSGSFDYRKFDIVLSGSGEMACKASCDSVELKGSGSGKLRLEGEGRDFLATLSGSGQIEAADFRVKTARLRISGSGSAALAVDGKLEAELSGSGSLSYRGDPELSSHVSGSGSIRRLGD
jgi:hypothetical protein